MSASEGADAIAGAIALLPEALLLVSGTGEIREANERVAEMLARRPAELAGRNLADFTAEDPAAVAAYLRLCARSRKLVPGALMLRADGAPIPCRCEGALLQARVGGAPALLLLRLVPKAAAVNRFVNLNLRIEELGKEIARRQRAESALREQSELLHVTLSSIGDAVIATDRNGCITFMNAVAELYTGWKQPEAAGRPLEEVFIAVDESSRAPARNFVAALLRKELPAAPASHVLLAARDGTSRPIDESCAAIRDSQGAVLGVVIVFRDVTERRARERETLEASRRKDEFLAMLAHELRNPLAVLTNGVQVIRARAANADAAVAQAGDAMQRQVRQLARLVDDLLDVSRITTGKIALRKALVPLDAVLRQAVELSQPVMTARSIDLRVAAGGRALTVEADIERLAQVFGNLLLNAAKFSEPGARVELRSSVEQGRAVVSVRDRGAGIPPGIQQAIFELFFQADSSLARSQGGLGVGLSIAKLITELHGGSIEVRSEGLGQGSEFIVRLPLAAPAAAQGVPGVSSAARSPRRILVVDDNADAAWSLATALEMTAHEVRVAHDGEAGLRVADEYQPEVVLLDIGLPGMDGYEVARRLRERPGLQHVLLVAVSGYGLDSRRAAEAGFDHHLTKPVETEVLETLMAAHR